jgi:hypothetical protein
MTLRSRYEQAVRDLHERVAEMRRDGERAEIIARAVHAERRRLAVLFKDLTPEPYRTRIYERTVRVYGTQDGPSIEFLRAKGKSWEEIIESAKRPAPRSDHAPKSRTGETDEQTSASEPGAGLSGMPTLKSGRAQIRFPFVRSASGPPG